jgi:hypothetical protein
LKLFVSGTGPGPCRALSLTQSGDSIRSWQDGAKITAVEPLNEKSYVPDRCTALYDTIGDTLNSVSHRLEKTTPEDRRSKVLVAIFTDGLENASVKYSSKQIQGMIKSQREISNWEFLFLAANQDAIATGGSIGVHRSQAINVSATPIGYQNVGEAVSFATAGVAGGQNVDSLNVQKHYDARLEEEEQKRKKK